MQPRVKQIKCLLIGNHGVGKTTMITRLLQDKFLEASVSSVISKIEKYAGNDYAKKNGHSFLIHDFGGKPDSQKLTKPYIMNSNVVIMVYDCTRPQSFYDLRDKWLGEVDKHKPVDLLKIFVGNKTDLPGYQDSLLKQITRFCREGGIYLYQISVKHSRGEIENVFNGISRMIAQKHK